MGMRFSALVDAGGGPCCCARRRPWPAPSAAPPGPGPAGAARSSRRGPSSARCAARPPGPAATGRGAARRSRSIARARTAFFWLSGSLALTSSPELRLCWLSGSLALTSSPEMRHSGMWVYRSKRSKRPDLARSREWLCPAMPRCGSTLRLGTPWNCAAARLCQCLTAASFRWTSSASGKREASSRPSGACARDSIDSHQSGAPAARALPSIKRLPPLTPSRLQPPPRCVSRPSSTCGPWQGNRRATWRPRLPWARGSRPVSTATRRRNTRSGRSASEARSAASWTRPRATPGTRCQVEATRRTRARGEQDEARRNRAGPARRHRPTPRIAAGRAGLGFR